MLYVNYTKTTIVVQNDSNYALAIFKHLDDENVYKKLKADITPEVCIKLEAFLKKFFTERLINKEMLDPAPHPMRRGQLEYISC